MTSTDTAERSGASRKIRWLAIGILLFIILYSGAWFLAAHLLQGKLQAFLGDQRAAPVSVDCGGMNVAGFPFRIGLFCDTVRLDDTARGASVSLGALRSAAQVYQPGHAVVELDGPAQIRVSPGLSVSADWSLLHASLRATLSGLDRLSLTYDQLDGTAVLPAFDDQAAPGGTDRLAFAARHGEVHLQQNGGDLDMAASVEGFDAKPADGASFLPPIDGSIDLTLTDRASLMEAGGLRPGALRGSKGEIRNLTLDLGEGMVATASGPFSIDDQGLISGELSVTMKNIEGWRRNLVKTFSDEDETAMVNNIANMLTALASGRNEATVKLNLRDGIAFLAFFPIGELPRL
ncbi:MAG TPA: DUF2125 domain-containing protein [Nordella sp.]|nr:DUF2125 domain-containing protein [Nordella sp.]